MTFSVVIVGLGEIGYRIDRGIECSAAQSHYQGFTLSDHFKIKFGIDPNQTRRREFESETGIPAYASCPTGSSADVAVIAASGHGRYSLLNEVINFLEPSVILCEKPLSKDLDDLMAIEALLEKRITPIFLNYFRRTLPEFRSLKKSLSAGEFGNIRKCSIWYSKGILNSASHFVDLMGWLFAGETTSCNFANTKLLDKEGDFSLRINSVQCYFLACNEEDFFFNSVEIMTSKARIKLDMAGRRIEITRATSRDANGLQALDFDSEIINVDFALAQLCVASQIRRVLMNGQCDLPEARELVSVTRQLIALQDLVTNVVKES